MFRQTRFYFCIIVLAGLSAVWAGCANTPSTGTTKQAASDLAVGDQVLVRFQVDAQGQWEAVGIDYQAEEQDGDNVECEDGLTPEGIECDGGPAANQDDGEEAEGEDGVADDDNVECEDGLTPEGIECDGGPAANQDDGEEAEDNEGTGGEWQMLVLPMQAQIGSNIEAFNFQIQLPPQMVISEPGNFRFTGRYLGGATFSANKVQLSISSTPRVAGRIQAITRLADGRLSIQVLDQTIMTHPNLRVFKKTSLEQEAELDTDGDTENDGINCEQEGKHEGENEGC